MISRVLDFIIQVKALSFDNLKVLGVAECPHKKEVNPR